MDGSENQDARPARRAEAARGGGPAEMGNALETLRIATTFIVVLYHAALTYVAVPLRLTDWVVYDPAGHPAFDTFIYWVNGFAMPVFFLAAGVSAPAACESRGARVFLTHRARRLLRPLLFGCVTIVPAFYLLWGYGLMATGRMHLDDILSWRYRPEIRGNLYGFGHLWFLEYLFVVCVLWSAGWSLRKALRRGQPKSPAEGTWTQAVLDSAWKPLLCAIPTAVIFLVDSDTMLRVDNKIVPNVFRVLHYAVFFAVGAWISKVKEPRNRLVPHSTLYLVLSVAVFALMSPLLLRHAAAPLDGWARVAFCALAALFPWLTVFGAVGVLLRVVERRGAAMRFLAEASFWIYLIHVPVVALTQILLLPLAWPGVVKFVIVAVVAIAVSVLSYEWIVRRSLIGDVVNGARKRSTKRGILGPEFGWIATVGVLALMFAVGAWHYRVFFWGNNRYEKVAGQFYRSARLKPNELERMIRERRVRSVVTFTGPGKFHPWVAGQQQVCQTHDVELHAHRLAADEPPSREVLVGLIELLDHCPRPTLVQSHRGIDQTGLASAVLLLLAGESPETALREFDAKYGQFDGAEHSALGRVLLSYQSTLNAQGVPHTATRFRAWARDEYTAGEGPKYDAEPQHSQAQERRLIR